MSTSDNRPANCRNRLQDEGRPYPKSGCDVGECRPLVTGCVGLPEILRRPSVRSAVKPPPAPTICRYTRRVGLMEYTLEAATPDELLRLIRALDVNLTASTMPSVEDMEAGR